MKTKNLPKWAKYNKDEDIIEVDPEVVYPVYLKKLGYDIKKLTQNQLECARRCFTKDLSNITGPGLHQRIKISKKGTFRFEKYPFGTPVNWTEEYKRISNG